MRARGLQHLERSMSLSLLQHVLRYNHYDPIIHTSIPVLPCNFYRALLNRSVTDVCLRLLRTGDCI
jgi:hypothetical protein